MEQSLKNKNILGKIFYFMLNNKKFNIFLHFIRVSIYLWFFTICIDIIYNWSNHSFITHFLVLFFLLLIITLKVYYHFFFIPNEKEKELKNFFIKQEAFEKNYRERGIFYNNPEIFMF